MSGGEAILGARCDDQGIGRYSLLRLGCEVGSNSKCRKAGRKGPVKYWEFCMAGGEAAVWLTRKFGGRQLPPWCWIVDQPRKSKEVERSLLTSSTWSNHAVPAISYRSRQKLCTPNNLSTYL